MYLLALETELAVFDADAYRGEVREGTEQEPFGNRVFHEVLDRAADGSRPQGGIVIVVHDKFLRLLADFQQDAAVGNVLLEEPHLDVHNGNEVLLAQGTEHDLLVDTVQEFWREHALDFFADGVCA